MPATRWPAIWRIRGDLRDGSSVICAVFVALVVALIVTFAFGHLDE